MNKIKTFIKKYQKPLLFIGGTVVGVTLAALFIKSKDGESTTVEVLPEWAKKWRDRCDRNALLYENGLPIFANDECTIVYRDACDCDALEDLRECGFEIIDRYDQLDVPKEEYDDQVYYNITHNEDGSLTEYGKSLM